MLKNLKPKDIVKILKCSIMSALVMGGNFFYVCATESGGDMPDISEPPPYTERETDIGGRHASSRFGFIHLTDEAFDVSDFGELDDSEKSFVYGVFAKYWKDVFEGIMSCDNLPSLKEFIEGRFFIKNPNSNIVLYMQKFGCDPGKICIEGLDFRVWYNRMSQLVQKDNHFLEGADKDQFLDFRVLFLREIFLRAIYVSISSGFSSDDMSKQRVYMVNKNLLKFAGNHPNMLSPNAVKLMCKKVGDLILRGGVRKTFVSSFLNIVDKSYKRTWVFAQDFGIGADAIDFSCMGTFRESKNILLDAYAKLKEADKLLACGRFDMAYLCVDESLELMKSFKSKYEPLLIFTPPYVIEEYESLFIRWNKIKNTLYIQCFIHKKFDEYKKNVNMFLDVFFKAPGGRPIDWFSDVIDVGLTKCDGTIKQESVEAVEEMRDEVLDLKRVMAAKYDGELLSDSKGQSLLRSLEICSNNISSILQLIENKRDRDKRESEQSRRKEEQARARIERQEFLKLKREQRDREEVLEILDRANQRRSASQSVEKKEKVYQITYINDDIKNLSRKFLSSDRRWESFWRKWFNEVRVSGSSTMNCLPNMKSQRAAFLNFKKGLIKIAPDDIIYEARLETSGEKSGMRIVYYVEKDTDKVVILYVGDPFGIIHKNLVRVHGDYANFPEACLEDCEPMPASDGKEFVPISADESDNTVERGVDGGNYGVARIKADASVPENDDASDDESDTCGEAEKDKCGKKFKISKKHKRKKQ